MSDTRFAVGMSIQRSALTNGRIGSVSETSSEPIFSPYGKVYFKYSDCPVHLDPNAEPDGL